MNFNLKKCILSAALAMAIPAVSYSQTDSTSQQTEDFTAISLEDLMNVKIVSASRSEEKAFEAPLSSFVITRKEIFNSGSTSIPDALRLCPGLFVKQMANGVYDVSIRGLDNLPTHQYHNTNKVILVMIDNRPVFDYLQGGTYWTNLPIDIIDVERIEVVLGPSAPLYGPNAVTGVINIITKGLDKNGVSAIGHAQAGAPGTYIGQGYIGYKANDKFNLTGSFNYQNRKRGTVDFYDFEKNQYITNLDSSSNNSYRDPAARKINLPNPDLAVEKTGANINANFTPSSDIKLHIGGGYNSNKTWYPIAAGTSTMTSMSNQSYFGMVKGDIKGFSILASVLNGTQGFIGNLEQFQYNYQNLDAYIDYTIKITDKFNLRPAINFQNTTVDDQPYTTDKGLSGLFNGKATMYNFAGSLKADYTLGKFRFIGALRGDKFKFPEKMYLSYQGIVNYIVNNKNNFRAIIARSNSGSFIYDTYANLNVQNIPSAPFKTEIWTLGSRDRKLMRNDMVELGYRGQLMENLQVDIAVFHQVSQNYATTLQQAPIVDMANQRVLINLAVDNLDLKAVQNGATIALNLALSKSKINIKPFVTIQKTRLLNYSPYYSIPAGSQNQSYTSETQSDVDGKATPDIFGGFYANYAPNTKWNFNLNGYLMSKYEIYTLASTTHGTPYKEYSLSNINGKFMLNAKISYQLTKNLNVFANARNAFDSDSREFFGTDLIHGLYLGGIHFDY